MQLLLCYQAGTVSLFISWKGAFSLVSVRHNIIISALNQEKKKKKHPFSSSRGKTVLHVALRELHVCVQITEGYCDSIMLYFM